MFYRRICCVVLVLSCAGIVSAAEWTEFRGPTGQGTSDATGLPVAWSDTENLAWKIPIPGLGWSSPVVTQGKIYLSTCVTTPAEGDKPETHEFRALCFDARDGAAVWNVELFQKTGEIKQHGKNSYASPTPVIDGENIYFHYGPYGTACVKLDGVTIWKNEELIYDPRHGTGGSPALADGVLVISCDGYDQQFVVGIDQATGKTRWRTPRNTMPAKGFAFSTPLVIHVNGKNQAVCPGAKFTIAYEPATGQEIWRCQYGEGYSVVPRPIYSHGLVFVSSSFDTANLLAIDPTGSGDVTQTHIKWQTDKQVPHSASMVAVEDMLFYVSDKGIATCADITTGKTHWQQRIEGNYSASLTAGDGRVYFQNEQGKATVVAASKTFEELATNSFAPGERTFASYGVFDKSLLIRSEKHLYRVGTNQSALAQ